MRQVFVKYFVFVWMLAGLFYSNPSCAQEARTIEEVRKNSVKSLENLLPLDKDNQIFFNALRSTYDQSPTLKAARADTRAVFERLPQADAGWRPTVNVEMGIDSSDIDREFDNQFLDNFSPDGSNTSKDAALTLAQPLYRGGSTFANIKAAKSTIKSQIAFLDQTEQGVLLAAAIAYIDVLRDELVLQLRINHQYVLKQQYEATDKRYKAGELTQTDVSQAESRYARADAEVIDAQGNLKSSRARFKQLIGYEPENLAYPVLHIDIPVTLEESLSCAENRNPGILSAQYAQSAAESDVDSIYGELLPSISLEGRMLKAWDPNEGIDNEDESSIGVFASMPLYEAGAVRSRVRQARHSVVQRYEKIAEEKRRTAEEVTSAWETFQAAKAEKKARMSQVEAADVARFGVKKEADFGSRTTLDVLDADQELLDAKVAFVAAQRNELAAQYGLAAAIGIFNPETLGFPVTLPDYNREIQAARNNLFGTSISSKK